MRTIHRRSLILVEWSLISYRSGPSVLWITRVELRSEKRTRAIASSILIGPPPILRSFYRRKFETSHHTRLCDSQLDSRPSYLPRWSTCLVKGNVFRINSRRVTDAIGLATDRTRSTCKNISSLKRANLPANVALRLKYLARTALDEWSVSLG